MVRLLLSTVLFLWCPVALGVLDCWADQDPVAHQRDVAEQLRRFRTNLQFNKDGSVRLVRLSKPHVTNDHLALLKSFPKLDYLAVVCPQVTDEGIAHVAGLANLDTLLLSESGVTSSGLSAIAKLSKLQRLYLESTEVGDDGLQVVGKLTLLEVLSLADTKITDRGLAHLRDLQSLDTLCLDGTAVTSQGLIEIGKLANLRILQLADCSVSSLAGLENLKQLKHLCLNGTPIDDSAVKTILACPSLETVELYGTKFTTAGLRKLKQGRPKLQAFISPVAATAESANDIQSSRPPNTQLQPVTPPISQRLADEVPDFQRHVVPLLGTLGCNGRSCHGSFQGQGGFRLSMFGYDFQLDHDNLTERIDLQDVDASLILNKPTSADEHEGGMRLRPGSWQQALLRRWIAGNAPGQTAAAAKFVRLEVSPAEIVFRGSKDSASLRAVAIWSDGTREDVTCLTRLETKDDAVAEVSAAGEVRAVGQGDTHIIATYDNGIVSIPVILPLPAKVETKGKPSTRIDELVAAKLQQLAITPSEIAGDEMFLRRLSLDLIGTLPSPDEIREFARDQSADKRQRKIEELMQRDAYVAWWTNLLCDLTGSNAGYLGGTEMAQPVAAQWRSWIELRVRENIGWDQIARGIITATSRRPGQTYADYVREQSSYTGPADKNSFAALGNPMPHFWYRDNISTPADKALAFGYTFMGVRLECAQCHKHPFDRWSKQDFDDFTQFFTRIKKGIAPDAAPMRESMRNMLGVPVKLNTAALRRQSYLRIAAEGRPIPWNEIYIDPPGEEQQIAKLLGGSELDLSEYADPREPLFRWLISEPNRYFAKSLVNRVWAHYFGTGIINPPDDLNLANPPSNAALLDYLTQGFIDSGYDMKWLHRTITSSDTYQRSWKSNHSNANDERHFSRAIVRRLPAEVAIDAVIQATASDKVLSRLATSVKDRKITQHPKSYQTRSIDYSLLVFGKPLRTTNCDCERQNEPTLVQSLFLRNDEETLAWIDRSDGWLHHLNKADIEPIDAEQLVQQAYLRVLSRLPRPKEAKDCAAHLGRAESLHEGMRDLLWALLNTQEFITNH